MTTVSLMLLALIAQFAFLCMSMSVARAIDVTDDDVFFSEITVFAGDTVIPPELVRTGYTFLGFAFSPDAEVPVFTADILLDDAAMDALFSDSDERELYAVWEKIIYNIDFPGDNDDDDDNDDNNDDDVNDDDDDDDDAEEPQKVAIGDTIYPPDPGDGNVIGYRSANPDGPIYPVGPFVLDEQAIQDIFGDSAERGQLLPVYEPVVVETLPYTPDPDLGDNSRAVIQQLSSPPAEETVMSDLEWLKDMDVPLINFGNLEIPLFSYPGMFAWSLINLILCTIGAVLFVIKLVRWLAFVRRERRTDEYIPEDVKRAKKRHSPVWLTVSCLMAVAGGIFFFIMEDMNFMMVLIDVWSLISAAILVIELIALSRVRVVAFTN